MDLASELGGAVSESVNRLCALLVWLDGGTNRGTPVDGAEIVAALTTLEAVAREIAAADPSHVDALPISADDLTEVARLRELLSEWTATGTLHSESVALAEHCVRALWGGVSWRDLVAARP